MQENTTSLSAKKLLDQVRDKIRFKHCSLKSKHRKYLYFMD